ncbi:MAG: SH3 domain-containing protein [Chloroflexi bacterium]|nr:SH3 domain-containing protein [Chloroflexota bacterium]
MDQDSRSPDPRRSNSPRAGSDQGQSAPLRIRQRELKTRNARATASAYLEKLLQTVSNTSQTAPIATSGPLFDRCLMLVQALGDPDNPAHIHAAEELVALGPVALPALIPALHPEGPWLTAYRAAEVLGEIGDRRAATPLVEALNHPNSNVRWSVVRALSAVGNTRALFALRRLARDDRSKTSWGESVAGVAQSAIDQMQGNNMMLKTMELVKTAISTVVFLLALVVAWNVFERVRGEMTVIGVQPVATTESGEGTIDTDNPPAEEPVTVEATATMAPTSVPVGDVRGVVLKPGNVRSQPAIQANNVVGQVEVDDELVFLATTPDRSWFKIRLGDKRSDTSSIDTPDGVGWVNQTLIEPPSIGLPIEDLLMPTRAPATSATPTQTTVVEQTATADANITPTVDPLQPQPTSESTVVPTATPEVVLPTETPTP